MGKSRQAPSRPGGRSLPKPAHGSRAAPPLRGVAKPMSALGASIAARKNAAGGSSSASAVLSSLAFLEQGAAVAYKHEDTQDLAAKVVSILRECVAEAGGSVDLTVLGSAVKDKAERSGLQQNADGSVRPINNFVKSTWGGWEAFVRSHASETLCVVGGRLQEKQDTIVDDATPEFSTLPSPPKASVSTRDVNALNFDAL